MNQQMKYNGLAILTLRFVHFSPGFIHSFSNYILSACCTGYISKQNQDLYHKVLTFYLLAETHIFVVTLLSS